MGHPHKHVFAVAEAIPTKVSMSSINTRFYLNQETVDFTKESPRAFEFMMRSTETKKKKKRLHDTYKVMCEWKQQSVLLVVYDDGLPM